MNKHITTIQLEPEILHGSSRLAIEAVLGVTDIVEAMHASIAGLAPIIGPARGQRARGISGLVYRSVRGVTRLVGGGLDLAQGLLPPIPLGPVAAARREALLAQLNGVIGDHLERTHNPLAIPMRLRAGGQALVLSRPDLDRQFPQAGSRLLVMAHGLCMNDLQWRRLDHDHGAALAASLGFTPLYLHYNTGRPIARNGEDLAALLSRLSAAWPQPIEELILIGHSMGGLVIRSALARAAETDQPWVSRVRRTVYLGTPHYGAPLERAGHLFNRLLDSSPYSAPIGRLGALRSAGIQDLRHGRAPAPNRNPRRETGSPSSLPPHLTELNIAATRSTTLDCPPERLKSDGLVPVNSALAGQAGQPHAVIPATGHLDLLASQPAFRIIERWLTDY